MLFHFSEDPTIRRFVPHVPRTNPDAAPAVWAIDAEHAPLYWFPRDCPRATVWARDDNEQEVLGELLHTTARRVHATELGWLDRIRHATLWQYTLDVTPFRPWPEASGQWIATEVVEPVSVEPVGELLTRHMEAGIELRFVPNLWPLWDVIVASGLDFSGVRLQHGAPRPGAA